MVKETQGIYKVSMKTLKIAIVREPESNPLGVGLNPRDIYNLAKVIYSGLDADQEHFTLFFLDTQKITGYKTVFSGGQYCTIVDPKIVFRNALLFGATRIILCHNHPGGNTTPSGEDMGITSQLVEAGKIIGIDVIDHIIITPGRGYLSMKEKGLL